MREARKENKGSAFRVENSIEAYLPSGSVAHPERGLQV